MIAEAKQRLKAAALSSFKPTERGQGELWSAVRSEPKCALDPNTSFMLTLKSMF